MWLKVTFDEKKDTSPENPYTYTIEVNISDEKTAPVDDIWKTFRLSPIFPLLVGTAIPNISDCTIYFFTYKNAFRVLGRLDTISSDKLKSKIFVSIGLCSVMLISSDPTDLEELKKIADVKEDAWEMWILKNKTIETFDFNIEKNQENIPINILDYASLPLGERVLIDEFKITIKLLLLKLTTHMPFELPKIQSLIEEVNILIAELIYLNKLDGDVPESLNEYNKEDLAGKKINQAIKHQNIDRIIQINSALSYVSTQAFSGAIPILERRSLIRRHSLLGVGSAILALNNIARNIENSFSKISFDEIITKQFVNASALSGLDQIPRYDSTDWQDQSINKFSSPLNLKKGYLKLPYFSGRLGFREAEYSIAAAIQSISGGASIEWSLMTISHEMLHGHVRTIINALFLEMKKAIVMF